MEKKKVSIKKGAQKKQDDAPEPVPVVATKADFVLPSSLINKSSLAGSVQKNLRGKADQFTRPMES